MRHNNKILFKLMLVVLTLSSCNKFLDINSDPNRVTDANITPELIFTQAEVAVGARQASGNFTFMNHWVGYAAENGGFAPQADEVTYTFTASFCDPIWIGHYHVLFDLSQSKSKGLASGNVALAGASMVLSAKLFQELVDLYGNIPYTQAFQVGTTTTPAYDDAKTIYSSLQLQLDSAIMLFGEPNTTGSKFANADVIAQGNTDIWIKFANTLKLRLLIRQSEVSGFDPSADIAKINANGGPLGAGESIAVNPGFVNDVNKQNPFYGNYGWSPTGVLSDAADNANNYDLFLLGASDPRLGRFWYPTGFTGNTFAGANYGEFPGPQNLSYFGPALVGNLMSQGALFVGDGSGAINSMWIMPAFESMFLYAEALARGWVPGMGDAEAKLEYNAAVAESFTWMGVPDPVTAATDFVTNNPEKDYSDPLGGGTTLTSKVDFLALQKYISMTMIDPLEAYADIRRLNMLPTDATNTYISVAQGNTFTSLPLRLYYPQSETTTNDENVKKQPPVNLYTTKLFWEP